MRRTKGLLAILTVAGVVGCSSSTARLAAISPSPTVPAKTGTATEQAGPSEPKTKAGARAAAARFYGLYVASQFAGSWDLLAPDAKRQVSRAVWVGVHHGCPSASAAKVIHIKAVTVFGEAAIVTSTIAGGDAEHRKARSVFNYVNGHWGYSPTDISVYQHGSVAADIAAARAAGFCTRRTASPL